jgi:hypothetical protein
MEIGQRGERDSSCLKLRARHFEFKESGCRTRNNYRDLRNPIVVGIKTSKLRAQTKNSDEKDQQFDADVAAPRFVIAEHRLKITSRI